MRKKLSGMTEFIKRNAGSLLNENTNIPLKILVPLFAFLIPVTWRLSGTVSDVKHDFRDLKAEVRTMNEKSWTRENMELWATKLERNNPAVKVPAAKEGLSLMAPAGTIADSSK
jgi:hypothetical protein